MRSRDRRLILLGAIVALFLLGLTVRSFVAMPPAAGRLVNRAIDLDGRGEKQAAYETLQSVVVACPEDPDAWVRTGIALARLDRPFEAAVYFSKAVDLDPASRIARVEYVKGLMNIDMPGEAQVVLEDGLRREPEYGGYLYLAAALAASRGDAQAAAQAYRLAVDNDAWKPDRFRHDAHFDPVRNDLTFLQAVYDSRVPGSFLPSDVTSAR